MYRIIDLIRDLDLRKRTVKFEEYDGDFAYKDKIEKILLKAIHNNSLVNALISNDGVEDVIISAFIL